MILDRVVELKPSTNRDDDSDNQSSSSPRSLEKAKPKVITSEKAQQPNIATKIAPVVK